MNILKNFFFVLNRFKTSSVLNVLGLSAAIFVFFVVAIQIRFDTTFNSCFKSSKNIYQFITNQDGNYDRCALTKSVNVLLSAAPEIKNTGYLNLNMKTGVYIQNDNGEKKSFDDPVSIVNKGFIEIFQPEIIEGNVTNLVSESDRLMISEKTAQRLFGSESAIGKTVFFYKPKQVKQENSSRTIWEETPGIVAAVYKDFPKNTTFDNNIFAIAEASEDYIYDAYFEIEKSSLDIILKKINTKEVLDQVAFFVNGGYISYDDKVEKEKDVFKEIRLEPIKNIQTRYPQIIKKGSDVKTVYFLIGIGIFVLIIAYINFINFSAALAPVRMKSVNIRRILGAKKGKIRFVIGTESVMFSFLSCIIALFGIAIFNNSNLLHLFTADFTLQNNWLFLLILIGVLLVFALLIGLYPASYITKLNPVSLFNNVSGLKQSSKFRYSLIVLQFVAAIMLVTIALFMKLQINYMENYTTGIEKENIIYVENEENKDNNQEIINSRNFAQEVMKNPSVSDYAMSSQLPGIASSGFFLLYINGEEYRYNAWSVDNNFPAFFGLTTFEGTSFDKSDNTKHALVNRTFVEKHKTKDVIGKILMSPDMSGNVDCIGVVNDFNFEPLNNVINPLLIASTTNDSLKYIFFKVSGKETKQAITDIKTTWKKFSDTSIEVKFLDKIAEQQYKMEKNMMDLVSIASLIIILIAVMGVYGLITFNMKSRSKEIAIRKINGAEEKSIMLLVNKNLLVQFVIGFALSIVPTIWVVEKWAEQFPYKASLHWWIFALAGLMISAITFITVSWQSWRAATTNPVESLKTE